MMTFSRTPFRTPAITAAFCVSVFTSSVALAAPASVDPGQVGKRFQPTINTPQAQPRPVITRAAAAPAAKEKLPNVPAGFVLKQVSVEGATALSSEDLAATYRASIGKKLSAADAQAIARRITDLYRSQGYILSQASVPQQSFANGQLKIKAVEGYISKVVLTGDVQQNDFRNVLQSYASQLEAIRPVRAVDVERTLLVMNDLPGATVRGMVRPTGVSGNAELAVTVTHKMLEGSLSMDNRGSKFIGPLQYSAVLAANSVLGMYDRTVVRGITTSPAHELRYFDVSHQQPINSMGTKAGINYAMSRTEPGDSLSPLEIVGKSNYGQINISHPILRTRKENLDGRLAFDMRNTTIDSLGSELSDDRLRVLRAGASYDTIDSLNGVNLADLEVSHGLNILNASNSGTRRSRTDGDADFTKVVLDAARTQSLTGDFTLFAGASGQYAFNRLLVAEQYSLGGVNYGRGYDPSELSGDHALAGKLELRWDNAPQTPYLDAYQLYGFYDIGRTWLKDTAGDDKSLASTGLGIRANFNENFSGQAEIALPLTKEANNQGGHGDDPRLYFGITGAF